MSARLHAPLPLAAGAALALPPAAARHAQVLRLQPGDAVVLFRGDDDREWAAQIVRMRRDGVDVEVGEAREAGGELPVAVTLAVAMPANDRMDALVEKATELGVARVQPLVSARSVLRLDGARADARRDRWQAIAVAASEQSGRTRVPAVERPLALSDWLAAATGSDADAGATRWLLHPDAGARPVADAACALVAGRALVVLSGPEGGLDAGEVGSARALGFEAVGLGPRILRADTAPLAALAVVAAAASRADQGHDPGARAGTPRAG